MNHFGNTAFYALDNYDQGYTDYYNMNSWEGGDIPEEVSSQNETNGYSMNQEYQLTKNYDISIVLHRVNGEWKIVSMGYESSSDGNDSAIDNGGE